MRTEASGGTNGASPLLKGCQRRRGGWPPQPFAVPDRTAGHWNGSIMCGWNQSRRRAASNPRLGVSFTPLLSPHAFQLLSLILGILVYLVSHSIAPSPPGKPRCLRSVVTLSGFLFLHQINSPFIFYESDYIYMRIKKDRTFFDNMQYHTRIGLLPLSPIHANDDTDGCRSSFHRANEHG